MNGQPLVYGAICDSLRRTTRACVLSINGGGGGGGHSFIDFCGRAVMPLKFEISRGHRYIIGFSP